MSEWIGFTCLKYYLNGYVWLFFVTLFGHLTNKHNFKPLKFNKLWRQFLKIVILHWLVNLYHILWSSFILLSPLFSTFHVTYPPPPLKGWRGFKVNILYHWLQQFQTFFFAMQFFKFCLVSSTCNTRIEKVIISCLSLYFVLNHNFSDVYLLIVL